MTLSKEPLTKSQEMLQKDYEEKWNALQGKIIEMKTMFKVGNFELDNVERGWRENEDYHRVNFKHAVQDLQFYYEHEKGIDRISWSSWSYSYFKTAEEKKQSIDKSFDYISAVQEMLVIMKDEENLKVFVEEQVIPYWKENILPRKEECYEIERQIDEIKSTITSIDKNAELEIAKAYLLEKERYTSEYFYLNNTNSIKEIKVSQDKKGNFIVVDANGRNKKIDDYMILNLYRHLTQWNIRREINFDVDYYSPERYNHYKYQTECEKENCYTYNNKNLILISKEEFEQIQKSNSRIIILMGSNR